MMESAKGCLYGNTKTKQYVNKCRNDLFNSAFKLWIGHIVFNTTSNGQHNEVMFAIIFTVNPSKIAGPQSYRENLWYIWMYKWGNFFEQNRSEVNSHGRLTKNKRKNQSKISRKCTKHLRLLSMQRLCILSISFKISYFCFIIVNVQILFWR